MTQAEMSPLVLKLIDSEANSRALLDGVRRDVEKDHDSIRDLERRFADFEQRVVAIEARSAEESHRSAAARTIWVPLTAAVVSAIVSAVVTAFIGRMRG